VEAFALSRTLRFAGGPGEVRKIAGADAELSWQRQRRRTRDVRRADRPSRIPDQTEHRDEIRRWRPPKRLLVGPDEELPPSRLRGITAQDIKP